MASYELPTDMSRRVFVKGVGYVSVGFLFSSLLGGCESILEQIRDRPLRRRLRTGSPEVDEAIEIYKFAVAEMQSLPDSNPRSWAAQAALHGTVTGGFNFCQHGNAHFFSWHRAYLFHFERICQELAGEPDFGLPYWNWNQNPSMHPEFTASGSILNHPRNNTSVAGNTAFSNSTLNTIIGDSNFFTFSSQLEGSPHNQVHIVVGQDMVSGGSPLDPIFWPHHCMVDYCWAKWNIELENDNPNDSSWTQTSWDHFTDGNGDLATNTAGGTILMPFLSYRYETSPVGGFAAARLLSAQSAEELRSIEQRLRRGADVRFEIRRRFPVAQAVRLSLAEPFSAQTRLSTQDFTALLESDQREERVFLNVAYAELPPTNDFFVRVFLNLPEANARVPTDDPHYAGSFAFFGTRMGEHQEGHGKTDFLVNVTETLQRLRRNDLLGPDEPLSVQLVAVPVDEELSRPDAVLMLREVDLVISPIGVRTQQRDAATVDD